MKAFMEQSHIVTKIVLACYVRAGKGRNTHNDRPSHGLAVFMGGERIIAFASGEKLRVPGGSLVYFPKGSSYVVHQVQQADCYAINFQLAESVTMAPFVLQPADFSALTELFKLGCKYWGSREPGRDMKLMANLYEILFRLQSTGQPHRDRRLQPALEYIHSHYTDEAVSNPELAQLCGMSQVYLRRLFTRQFGMAPNRYIRQLRLERACQLLTSGLYTVSECCYQAGFRDESYFIREFKKHYGNSPRAYAQRSL